MHEPPALPAPPVLPPPAAPRFTLPLSAWIASGLYGVVVCFLVFQRSAPLSAYEWGNLLGRIIAGWLMPTLVAWLVWRLAKRSDLARTIAFFAVFGLILLGQLGQAARSAVARRNFDQLQDDQQRFLKEQREAFAAGTTLDPTGAEKYVENTAEHLKRAAASSSGNARHLAAAGQAFADRMLTVTRRYNAALAELNLDTFFNFGPLKDSEIVASRRKAVEEFGAANAALQDLQGNGGPIFRLELEQRGVSGNLLRETLASYDRTSHERLPLLLKIRELDFLLVAELLAYLDLADGKSGKWEKDEAENKIVFEDPAAAARYNEVLSAIQSIGAEQSEMQQRLIGTKPPAAP